MRAETQHQLPVRKRSGADNVGTAPACDLDGKVTHATGRAEDQHALAALEPAVVGQRLPGTEARQGDRGALDVIQRSRLRCEVLRGGGDELRRGSVSVEPKERVYSVADFDITHVVGNSDDDP